MIKLEKKLKTSLYDAECQEKQIRLEQNRLEQRKKEIEQTLKLKQNEIAHSLKRYFVFFLFFILCCFTDILFFLFGIFYYF